MKNSRMKANRILKDEKIILAAILLVSVYLRMMTFGDTLIYFDSYHHLSSLREFLEKPSIPMYSSLSRPPEGAYITEPFGFFLLPIILSPFIGPFQAVGITTVIFGALVVFASFLLSRELFGRKAGLITASIVAFLPAAIFKSLWGDFRGDSMGMAFWLFSYYFLFRGLREKNNSFLILSGILISASSFFWLGGFFGLIVFFSYFFAVILKNFYLRKKTDIYLPMFIPVIILPYAFRIFTAVPDPFIWVFSGVVPVPAILSAGILAMKFLLDKMRIRKTLRAVLCIALLSGAAIAAVMLNPITQDDLIAELHDPTPDAGGLYYTWTMLSLALPLGIAGLWFLRKADDKSIFIIMFLLIGLFAFTNGKRFIFLLGIPISISSSIFISRYENYLPKRPKIRAIIPPAAILLILGFLLISGYQFSIGNFYRPDASLLDAMNWLKNNTPKDAIIMTWWDRGGFVQGIAERKSWVDGTEGQDFYKIREMTDSLLSEGPSETIKQADYIVLPFEDVMVKNKWWAILARGERPFAGREFLIMDQDGDNYYGDNLVLHTVLIGNNIHAILDNGTARIFAKMTTLEMRDGERIFYVTRLLNETSVETGDGKIPVGLFGAMLFGNKAILVPAALMDTLYVRLNLIVRPVEGLEMVYSNGEIKIYKVIK